MDEVTVPGHKCEIGKLLHDCAFFYCVNFNPDNKRSLINAMTELHEKIQQVGGTFIIGLHVGFDIVDYRWRGRLDAVRSR